MFALIVIAGDPNEPFLTGTSHFAYVAFFLQKICRQNDTLFRILCHMAYGHFAYRNRLDATKLCVKLPISVGQMRQNLFQHLSHSAYKMGCKIRII
jgi:hypothetical protein